jgi:hypothetical protein
MSDDHLWDFRRQLGIHERAGWQVVMCDESTPEALVCMALRPRHRGRNTIGHAVAQDLRSWRRICVDENGIARWERVPAPDTQQSSPVDIAGVPPVPYTDGWQPESPAN